MGIKTLEGEKKGGSHVKTYSFGYLGKRQEGFLSLKDLRRFGMLP